MDKSYLQVLTQWLCLNAGRTLILKPIKFWMHVKSFSYAEWPEPTKKMLTIYNADSCDQMCLFRLDDLPLTLNPWFFNFLNSSQILTVLTNVLHLMCLWSWEIAERCQAIFTFLLYWIQIQIRLYVKYRERHVGNVNCFLSTRCLGPGVLIKCRHHFFMCDESCLSSSCDINLTEGQTWAEKQEKTK